jgi:hypothetical protein
LARAPGKLRYRLQKAWKIETGDQYTSVRMRVISTTHIPIRVQNHFQLQADNPAAIAIASEGAYAPV